jgi:hypothetical protein
MAKPHKKKKRATESPTTSQLAPRRSTLGLSANDLAYRRALGLSVDAELPNQLGVQGSAGASRGGRGASNKGKGRNS